MVNQVESVFLAQADPTRRQVIHLLSADSLPAGELARSCGMSGPAMSRHLRVLRRSGLVEVLHHEPQADARVRVYRLRPEPFRSLQEWIDHMQRFWERQLTAFKLYAEQEHSQPNKRSRGKKK